MKIDWVAMPLALALVAFAAPAGAQNPDPLDIRACTAIGADAQRLACYDHATHRDLPRDPQRADANVPAAGIFKLDESGARVPITQEPRETAPPRSLLDSRWELASESKLGTFNLRGYQPLYVLPVFATSKQNKEPHSPNPNNTATQREQLDNVEAKFQLSLKTKIWQGVFGDAGDVWMGYTQSSRWQVYNSRQSRPFRETNYEPEVLLAFDTHYHVFGWDGRLLGIGIDHQSNGRSDPLSRSWNRVIADVGLERDGWTVMLRPWWRIHEARRDDNNADISNYMGRGEMQVLHVWNAQEFGVTLRHSLRSGNDSHGSARFSWSFPMAGNLRGYVEAFSGYGESLIDYNHNATYLGVGVSLLDWY
ncbi:MAG: phospholipase A [Dokdonella sp.]